LETKKQLEEYKRKLMKYENQEENFEPEKVNREFLAQLEAVIRNSRMKIVEDLSQSVSKVTQIH
jgi:hypothetical protein